MYANAPVGLAYIDASLHYARVNETLATMIGLPASEIIGRDVSDIVHFTEKGREDHVRQLLLTGEPWLDVPTAGEMVSAPGRRRRWITSYYPIRSGGRAVGLSVVVRDVTSEGRAEEFRRHILGIVGHDLRSPLSSISLSADALLRRPDTTEEQTKYIARIRAGTARMTNMIRDLLDCTRARVGERLPIAREPADISDICRHAVDEASAGNPRRTFAIDGSGPTEGEWDPDRLAQVMSNLLGNAVAYSPPDAPVKVTWRGTPEAMSIEVQNAGPAISPDLLPRIFEPFRRENYETGGRHGLGLGLFITHEIVVAHGGTIEASSTEGSTVFRVTLPRQPST